MHGAFYCAGGFNIQGSMILRPGSTRRAGRLFSITRQSLIFSNRDTTHMAADSPRGNIRV
jgi:hypothetical protein